jgi:hypothetical protein
MNSEDTKALGLKIISVVHRHPPVSSGLEWGLKTFSAHLGEPHGKILIALAWLRKIGAVEDRNGEVVLTERGRELAEPLDRG